MKKKATILLALISMCLIATAGIGAITASDETLGSVTVSKTNLDGTTTVVETFEGSGPMAVTATMNEDGNINITKEDKQRIFSNDAKNDVYITSTTPETKIPMKIEEEDFGIIADSIENLSANTLMPSEKIDASGKALYYEAHATNHPMGYSCNAYSYSPEGSVLAEASSGYLHCHAD
jgi:hypothetical protein